MTATMKTHCYEDDNRVFTFNMDENAGRELCLDWIAIMIDNDEAFELEVKKD